VKRESLSNVLVLVYMYLTNVYKAGVTVISVLRSN